MVPASGHLVLAFVTENPGAWLMHYHIGWHLSQGFAMQFVEQYDAIAALTDSNALERGCEAWKTYAETASVEQKDSGV